MLAAGIEVVEQLQQRFGRVFHEFGEGPDPRLGFGVGMVETGNQVGFDLLQAGGFGTDLGKGAVRTPKRHGESARDDESARVWIARDETCDVLNVAGAELEALGFTPGVPD